MALLQSTMVSPAGDGGGRCSPEWLPRGCLRSLRSEWETKTAWEEPAAATFSLASPLPAAQTTPVIIHTVTRSDTLEGIALQYGIEVCAVRSANHLWAHESLQFTDKRLIYIPIERCTAVSRAAERSFGIKRPSATPHAGGRDGGAISVWEQPPAPNAAHGPPACRRRQRQYGSISQAERAFFEAAGARGRTAAASARGSSSRRPSPAPPPSAGSSSSQRSSVSSMTYVDVDTSDWELAKATAAPPWRPEAPRAVVGRIDTRRLSFFPGRGGPRPPAQAPVPPPAGPPPAAAAAAPPCLPRAQSSTSPMQSLAGFSKSLLSALHRRHIRAAMRVAGVGAEEAQEQ